MKYSGPEGKVTSTVRTLLEAGANANASSSSGNIALHLAAKHCQLEPIELLLEHHSDVNAQRRRTRLAPLHKACGAVDYQKAKAVRLLLDGGASLDYISLSGCRPFDSALRVLLTAEINLRAMAVPKASSIYWPCLDLRECVEAIAILLDCLEEITLNNLSRNNIARSHLFRGLDGFEDLPMRDARLRFREVRVEIILLSDEDLYSAIRDFGYSNLSMFACLHSLNVLVRTCSNEKWLRCDLKLRWNVKSSSLRSVTFFICSYYVIMVVTWSSICK